MDQLTGQNFASNKEFRALNFSGVVTTDPFMGNSMGTFKPHRQPEEMIDLTLQSVSFVESVRTQFMRNLNPNYVGRHCIEDLVSNQWGSTLYMNHGVPPHVTPKYSKVIYDGSIVSWATMIVEGAQNDQAGEAINTFDEMVSKDHYVYMAILRKDGCLAAINERPTDFIDNNKWNEMDENAIADLHLALADEVLSSIEEKKTAKEIWDHLTKFYKIEPQERAELLLQSLPDSYDQLIINLKNNILTDHLVFDDVAATILEEENQCKNKEDRQGHMQQAEALTAMRGRSTERGQSSTHNHGRSKSRSEKIAANLYMLKGETLQEAEASVASCSSDPAMLSHQKLGHMSEQGMKVLVEQKLLSGLTKVSLPLCEHCITKDKLQREEENDGTVKEKVEATQIQVEKEFEQRDSFEAEPEHEELETENSEAPTTRQSDRVKRHPNWHSDYVIEGNVAYCLLTEDGDLDKSKSTTGDGRRKRINRENMDAGSEQILADEKPKITDGSSVIYNTNTPMSHPPLWVYHSIKQVHLPRLLRVTQFSNS
ncbi:hypothetical protein V6N11_057239 [Hibiscus sabdariffa]|uniref:GAG-pre-integrase domain-containing protein n=1 Tax=Hibiscus sabdariffa TaxID=183260 RepID=A0ABR2NKE4_9ROSI